MSVRDHFRFVSECFGKTLQSLVFYRGSGYELIPWSDSMVSEKGYLDILLL
jgi:hypothetical protein